jgi:hypothetical protein
MIPGKEPLGTHWVVSRADPDALEKMKISCPCRESRDDSSILHPIVSSLTDYAVIADFNIFFNSIILWCLTNWFYSLQ